MVEPVSQHLLNPWGCGVVMFKQDQLVVVVKGDNPKVLHKQFKIVRINADDSAVAKSVKTGEEFEIWPDDCKPV